MNVHFVCVFWESGLRFDLGLDFGIVLLRIRIQVWIRFESALIKK